ncbi:MAG: hypothetical protein NC489_30645, partial [Ruminococcus flavefaciens]|nr:hypothetical protein [Ruminococcus flavefaciens]
MIKVEHIEVWGWEHAIRGMRNPMNSWAKSDTVYGLGENYYSDMKLGPNDLSLMRKLFNGGTEHRKYLRQIIVSLDITAPLYWWKEFDTYKVGTVANSCSTMHKIQAKEFTLDDFSFEHLLCNEDPGASFDYPCIIRAENKNELTNGECVMASLECLKTTIDVLNTYRHRYLRSNNKLYWWQMIQLLP